MLTQLFHVTLTTGTQGKMEEEVTAGGICVDSCAAEFMIIVSQMSRIREQNCRLHKCIDRV